MKKSLKLFVLVLISAVSFSAVAWVPSSTCMDRCTIRGDISYPDCDYICNG